MASRSKEFGLFLTLGMTKKEISKLIRFENNIIALISLFVGLLSGTIFSKLFFMIAVKIIGNSNFQFNFIVKSYTTTIGVYLGIYILFSIIIKRIIKKLEVKELLTIDKKIENNKLSHPFLGFLGLFMTVGSYILLYWTLVGELFTSNLGIAVAIYILMCLVGLYLVISQFGGILKYLSPGYRNILFVRETNYKFNQLKRIIYVITILSALAIFYIGSVYGLYATIPDRVSSSQTYDVMYMQKKSDIRLTDEDLNKILEDNEVSLVNSKKLEAISMSLFRKLDEDEYKKWSDKTIILSDEKFNDLTNKNIDVLKGHAITNPYIKESKPWFDGGIIKLMNNGDNKEYNYTFQEEIYGAFVNHKSGTTLLVILDLEDYLEIFKSTSLEDRIEIRLLNFTDWKETNGIYENIFESLKPKEGFDENIDKYKARYMWNWYERPTSKLLEYDAMMMEYGFTLFIMMFLGILFFISTGVILYLQIFKSMERASNKYNKLFKIGITGEEIKKHVFLELKTIFFVPIILGSLVAFGYISIMFTNDPLIGKLLISILFVIGVYLFIQTIFYLLTRSKYLRRIL